MSATSMSADDPIRRSYPAIALADNRRTRVSSRCRRTRRLFIDGCRDAEEMWVALGMKADTMSDADTVSAELETK